ncbi:MAG: M23 family metallopeptidase [Dehalococcoidia bacterium]|nr:M23 family metallopeptidase [Dehalococcoidia bacterium]
MTRAVGLWVGLGLAALALVLYRRRGLGGGGLRHPIPGARITSRFGVRVHPVTGEIKNHAGIDYGAASGTPVVAAADGIVLGVNPGHATAGNYLVIGHSSNVMTRYLHLSAFAAGMRSGVPVTAGQVIGYVGMTGRVTGPHLHFEVRRADGSAVDPEVAMA